MLNIVRYRKGGNDAPSDPIIATAKTMREAAIITDRRNSELLEKGEPKRYYSDITSAILVPITTITKEK